MRFPGSTPILVESRWYPGAAMTSSADPGGTPRSSKRPCASVTAERFASRRDTSIPESHRRDPRSRTVPDTLTSCSDGAGGAGGGAKLNANWMRTARGSLPRRAGSKRRRRVAASADSSKRGCGGVSTRAAVTSPCASTSSSSTTRAPRDSPAGYSASTAGPVGLGAVIGIAAVAGFSSGCGSGTGWARAPRARTTSSADAPRAPRLRGNPSVFTCAGAAAGACGGGYRRDGRGAPAFARDSASAHRRARAGAPPGRERRREHGG